MKNNYYALFHLIKRKVNKRGLAPIYLRLTVDGNEKSIVFLEELILENGIHVKKKQWAIAVKL